MTQEDKDLVLRDMCSRVPYRLRLWIKMYEGKPDHFINSHNILSSVNYIKTSSPRISINGALYDIEGPEYSHGEQYIKPYLRSLSSMTEEESKDFALLQTDFYVDGFLYPIAAINMVNWLNAHHFDYRGLIGMGLALEAPKEMY